MTLVLKPDHSRELYELTQNFNVQVRGEEIWIPSGFKYDGASIPSAVWQAIYTPFNPMVMVPAVVHDWLYYNHQVRRKKADKILRDLLRRNEAPTAKVWAIYQAVRSFGKPYWNNNNRDIKFLKSLYKKHELDNEVDKFKFPDAVIGN